METTYINHLCYLDGDRLLQRTDHPSLPKKDEDLTADHAEHIFQAFGLPIFQGRQFFFKYQANGWKYREDPVGDRTYWLIYNAYLQSKQNNLQRREKKHQDRLKRIKGGPLKTAFDRLPYDLYRRFANGDDPNEQDTIQILALYGCPADLAKEIYFEIEQQGWPSAISRIDHIKSIGAELKQEARNR